MVRKIVKYFLFDICRFLWRNNHMKKLVLIPTLIAVLGLAACETVPYKDRAALYQKQVSDKYVGQSVDNVVLDLGPPSSTYPLTDGREMLQFETKKDGYYPRTSGYVSVGTGWGGGWHRGNYGGIGIGIPFPMEYPDGYNSNEAKCVKRFIVNKQKLVESFAFEGKGCF